MSEITPFVAPIQHITFNDDEPYREFYTITANGKEFHAYACLLEVDPSSLLSSNKGTVENVKIIANTKGRILAMFSTDTKQKLYQFSQAKLDAHKRNAQLFESFALGSDERDFLQQKREEIEEERGKDVGKWYDLARWIPMHRQQAFAIPVVQNPLEKVSYTFEEIEAITRARAIIEAAEFYEGSLDDISKNSEMRSFYEDYMSVGRYLSGFEQREKNRSYEMFIERAKEYLG